MAKKGGTKIDLLWLAGGAAAAWYFGFYCLQNGSDDGGILPKPPFLPTLGGCEFPCTLIHQCENILDMGLILNSFS
jgi:hypothetical protein